MSCAQRIVVAALVAAAIGASALAFDVRRSAWASEHALDVAARYRAAWVIEDTGRRGAEADVALLRRRYRVLRSATRRAERRLLAAIHRARRTPTTVIIGRPRVFASSARSGAASP